MTDTLTTAETLPLAVAAASTPTSLWNDSADPRELARSIAFGAVGATCNPVIALAAISQNLDVWAPRIAALAAEFPTAGESELGWKVVEELSIQAAVLLEPAFRESNGRNGRLSIQTDPRLHRDADALVEQAVRFSALAENIIVKIPATAVGIRAIEEATYRGVSINATVSFTVAQAVALMPRRLAQGVRREGPHPHRSRLPRVGGRSRVEGGSPDLHRTRVPVEDPLRCLPEPPAVVRTGRR
jgi:transaldolase